MLGYFDFFFQTSLNRFIGILEDRIEYYAKERVTGKRSTPWQASQACRFYVTQISLSYFNKVWN